MRDLTHQHKVCPRCHNFTIIMDSENYRFCIDERCGWFEDTLGYFSEDNEEQLENG